MKTFNSTQISEIISKTGLFIPPELVIAEMLQSGYAKTRYGEGRQLSEKKYFTDEKQVLNAAKAIAQKGHAICISNTLSKEHDFPKMDEVFESFIQMSEKEIILVSPFISVEFVSDIEAKLMEKKSIVRIITNPPGSRVSLSDQSKIIATLRQRGLAVDTTNRDIHAKIYIFDGKAAIIGSSNLSRHGFFDFYEMGVVIFGEDCLRIKRLLEDLL